MTKDSRIILNNGVSIPPIMLGCYMLGNTKETIKHFQNAIEIGYRGFDTAKIYKNEESVGLAIKEYPINREEIFVSTKLWTDDVKGKQIKEAFEESLKKLQLDYLDLYIIHWPKIGENVSTWHVLEELYHAGKVKSIGLSNFNQEQIQRILDMNTVVPMMNQIEIQPYLNQEELVQFCFDNKIKVESWGPLGSGSKELLENSTLKTIAEKHDKSVAQIILKWNIQRNIIPLPRGEKENELKENINIFDFELSKEEMDSIKHLNRGKRFGIDPHNFEHIMQKKREEERKSYKFDEL